MSLKRFHILFVAFVVLFSWGFGAWCLLTPALPPMFAWMGWMSVVAGVVCLVYGVNFWRKAKAKGIV